MVRSRRQPRCQPPRTVRDKSETVTLQGWLSSNQKAALAKHSNHYYLRLRPCVRASGPMEPRASWEDKQLRKSAHCTRESCLSAIKFLLDMKRKDRNIRDRTTTLTTTFWLLHVSGTWLNIWFVYHSPGLQRWVEAVCFSIWQRHHSYTLLGQKRLTNCGVCAWSEREIRYNISIDLR